LYNEFYYNPAPVPMAATFDTDFGVRFGMLICFDIFFGFPSKQYASEGVTDIVFSTDWINLQPFQTAIEMQQGYSRFYSANFLASGCDSRGFDSSGSGIYSSGEALAFYYNPTIERDEMLLVAKTQSGADGGGGSAVHVDLPTKAAPVDLSNEHVEDLMSIGAKKRWSFPLAELLESDESMIALKFHFFKAKPGDKGSFSKTSNNLTCTIHYEVSKDLVVGEEPEEFVAAVWSARDIPLTLPYPFDFCGISRCAGGARTICSVASQTALKTSATFTSISISGNFMPVPFTVFPLVASNDLQLLSTDDIDFTTSASTTTLTVTSALPILEAALFSVVHN